MADEDVIVAEVEADPIEAPNPIRDLLQSIEDGQYTDAEQAFNDIIGDRVQDKLDQEKVRIADEIFNGAEPEDESEEIEDDETLDAEIDDDFEEEDDYS